MSTNKVLSILVFDSENQLVSKVFRVDKDKLSWIPFNQINNVKSRISQIASDIIIDSSYDKAHLIKSDEFIDCKVAVYRTKCMSFVGVFKESEDIISKCIFNRFVRSRTDVDMTADILIQLIELDIKKHSKIKDTKDNIDDVHQTMKTNIQKIVENKESLEDLIIRTQNLQTDAVTFRKKTKQLNKCCFLF
jgi:hypothetical protein